MFDLFLTLHLLTAVFIVGPLVQTTTTATRGLRTADASATAAAARNAGIYAYASLVVVFIGFGLMSMKEDGKTAGSMGELWIWLSALLWAVGVALTLAVIVPTLQKATTAITNGDSVAALKGRVAASGGITGLLFIVIIVLMVYKPGH